MFLRSHRLTRFPSARTSWALAGLALATVVSAAALHAQATATWSGGGANNNWTTNLNWLNSLNPGNGASDFLIDASTLDLTADRNLNINSANRTLGTIKFGDTNAGGGTAVNNWTVNTGGASSRLVFVVSGGGTGTIQINNGTTTMNAGLAGSQGVTKTGAGTLVLNNLNSTLTGGYFLQAGNLSFISGSLGSNLITATGNATLTWNAHLDDLSSQLKVADGATLTLGVSNTAGENLTFATALQTGPNGTGSITKANAGNLTLTVANTYTGGTRVNNGRLILVGGDNRLSTAGALSFGNGANAGILQLGDAAGPSHQTVTGLSIAGTSNQVLNAVVGGAATDSIFTINNASAIAAGNAPTFGGAGANANRLALVKLGAGSLTLDKASTFTGNVTVGSGALIIQAGTALGTGSKTISIAGGLAAPSLQLSSATGLALPETFSLRTSNDDQAAPALVNTAGHNTIAGAIALLEGGYGGGQTRVQVRAGSLALTGAIAPDASALTPRTLILDGLAGTEGHATGALSDLGTTTLHLSKQGAGTWTLTGANTFSGGIEVQAGQLNLSASQTGAGAISIGDGATLGVVLSAASQTLRPSSLTLGSQLGGALRFDLGSLPNPAQPLIETSSFSTNGTTTVFIAGTGLSVGSFPLIRYTGTIGGDGYASFPAGDLSPSALPARVSGRLVEDAAHSQVVLSISKYDVPKWTGAQSNLWDINDGADPTTGSGTVNWREATSNAPTRYLQGAGRTDSALFDDTEGVPTVVLLGATLTPATVTVNASAQQYVFSGAGKLSGATSLLKQGTSTLTLLNTGGNDFTGSTTIAGGTLQVGDGATAGAGQLGSGPVVNNGTLRLLRPEDTTVANLLSGAGAVQKGGAGVLTLAGNNSTFAGLVTVLAGTLKLGHGSALGTPEGATRVESGAVLDLDGYAIAEPLQLGGGTVLAASGTAAALNGAVALEGGGTLQVTAGTLAVPGPLSGTGGLTKTGAGTLVLAGNATYAGGTTIGAGILQLGAAGGAGTTGAPGAGDILLNPASGTATLAVLRGDSALNLAQRIVSGGTGINALQIGVGGLASPSGLVTISGNNSFTGHVTVNGGALKITQSTSLGLGPKTVSLASNARPSLYLDGSGGDITLPAAISFSTSSDGVSPGTALQTPGAIVNLAGRNTIEGKIATINGSGGDTRLVSQGGTLTLAGLINADGATGVRTLYVSGSAEGIISGTLANGLSGTNVRVMSLQKEGRGAWLFSGAGSYTGATTVVEGKLTISGSLAGTSGLLVRGGTLELGASNVLHNAATLTLAGGTFSTGGFSENESGTAGLGLLVVSANSQLDFGPASASSLVFAGLGSHTAGARLSVLNWTGPDAEPSGGTHLFFQGFAAAFEAAYAQTEVSFNGVEGYIARQVDDTRFELLATVPEPSASWLLSGAGLVRLATFRRRSRPGRRSSAL